MANNTRRIHEYILTIREDKEKGKNFIKDIKHYKNADYTQSGINDI